MAELAWPLVATPYEFTLSRYTKVFRGSSAFGKSGQNVDTLNDRWMVSCSIGIRNKDDGAELEAFVNSLRSGSAIIRCPHFGRPTIRGVLTNPTTAAIAKGAQNLTINCAAGNYLKAGDMLGIGDQLFQVALDCQPTVKRASTATYIDGGVLKYAGVNEPRYQNEVLLTEPERTNLVNQSTAIEAWFDNGSSVETPYVAAPDGSLTARILPNTGTRFTSVTLPLGVVVTVSQFIHPRDSGGLFLYVDGNFGPDGTFGATHCLFNLVTGAQSSTANVTGSTIDQLANGWYRVSMTFVAPTFVNVHAHPWNAVQAFGGTQFEIGSVATSYIPTTTAPVTRAADFPVLQPQTTMRNRLDIPAGLTVATAQPTAKFRATPGASTSFGPGGVMMSTTLELVEVVT